MTAEIPGPDKLASLVSSVTEMMFGMSFGLASSRVVTPLESGPPWRTVLLPIVGGRAVTVAIAADEEGGRELGGAMFACDAHAVDDTMIADSLRELANIIAGQVKAAMGLDQPLGLPKIVADERLELAAQAWRTATLEGGATRVVVWVAVTESAPPA